jgi:hypothetical protein
MPLLVPKPMRPVSDRTPCFPFRDVCMLCLTNCGMLLKRKPSDDMRSPSQYFVCVGIYKDGFIMIPRSWVLRYKASLWMDLSEKECDTRTLFAELAKHRTKPGPQRWRRRVAHEANEASVLEDEWTSSSDGDDEDQQRQQPATKKPKRRRRTNHWDPRKPEFDLKDGWGERDLAFVLKK